jgi:NAD-dependent deacetylase
VRARLAAARSVCVLTGSGISSESGLPTFRGVGGLWRTHKVEVLASPAGFAADPELVWTWYNERRAAHLRATPSPAHVAIAALEERVERFALATQNVDGLHLRAGSRNVYEVHGSLREARCTGCGTRRTLDEPLPLAAIRHACGGRWRPDIVWFGEALPQDVWRGARAAAEDADLILVVGTSGLVNPAAALATHYGRGAVRIEINPEETVITPHADLSIRATASDVLPYVV